MIRLHPWVLLDTGPTDEDDQEIRSAFADVGMDAEVEGHPFGGPPSTAFLVAVALPLVPFLDGFAHLEVGHGTEALQRLATRLLAIRHDEQRWGRPHDLRLDDDNSNVGVLLWWGLPAMAYRRLLEVDVSAFDRGTPSLTIAWNERLQRWQARPTAEGGRVARRLPRRQRTPAGNLPGLRAIDPAEMTRLWQLAEQREESTVAWQRATMVLWAAMGWSAAAVGRRVLVSEGLVRFTIGRFNTVGFAALDPAYDCGDCGDLAVDEERDIAAIAAAAPESYGLPGPAWDVPGLQEVVVSQGVVEDVCPRLLTRLLSRR